MGSDKFMRNTYTVGGGLVVGNTTFQGNVNIEGNLVAEGTISSSSASLAVESLTATSDITAGNTINGSSDALIVGDISSSGTIRAVTGLASSSGTLDVDTSTLRGTVTASSDVNINNTLTVSSGATFTLGSTFSAGITVDNKITASSGVVSAVVTPSSGTNVPNHGMVILSATPAVLAYGLAEAPVIGQSVTFAVVGTTGINYIISTTALVNGTTTVFIGSTAGNVGRRLELTGPGASATMIGVTTGLWAVTSMTDTVGVVTTTTTT